MQDSDSGKDGAKQKTAIALKSYDEETKSFKVPKVVASGHGAIAEKIIELAKNSDIEIKEDANLAGILEKLEIGSEIPTEALIAVAEIMAYIYKVNNRLQEKGESIKE